MTRYQGLTANQMAGRILHREDNTYKKEIIKRVLDMYADALFFYDFIAIMLLIDYNCSYIMEGNRQL